MPLSALTFRPGITRDDTATALEGAWVDGNWVRFVRGLPQAVGGYEKATTDTVRGLARGLHAWRANDGSTQVAVGTHTHLYAHQGGGLYDITPDRAAGTLANPFATTAGSATVTVAHTGHGVSTGDRVAFDGAAAVGGITPAGEYTATRVDADRYTIAHTTPATATVAAGGGASVAYRYRLPVGLADGTGGAGFGTGTFGTGPFGSSAPADFLPRTWTLDNWGQNLVAAPRGGTVYEWALDPAARAVAIPGAPAQVGSIFVSPERILVACGAHDGTAYQPMLVRWSDQEDNTAWAATSQNLAGDFPLSVGNRIVRGLPTRSANLILTDAGAYAMTFLGDPTLVYGFRLVGEGCGLIAPHAAVETPAGVLWMSNTGQFFAWAGGGVTPVPCPMRADLFDHLAEVQGEKVVAAHIGQWNEVWWLYPDKRDGNEVSRYVAYNYVEGVWHGGRLARTAWIDAGALPHPLAVDPAGALYFHERGASADGGPLAGHLQSGFIDLGDGDALMAVRRLVPDFKDLQGAVNLLVDTVAWSQGAITRTPVGLVTADTQTLDTRLTARLMALRLEFSASPCAWRLGALRADILQTGSRR